MNHRPLLLACLVAMPFALPAAAEDGYDLWLRYPAADTREYPALESGVRELVAASGSATLETAQRELMRGLSGLAGRPIALVGEASQPGALFFGTPRSSAVHRRTCRWRLERVGSEGYVIRSVVVNGQLRHGHCREFRCRGAVRCLSFPAPGADAPAAHRPRHRLAAAHEDPRARSLGQPRSTRRTRLCRPVDLGLAQAAGLARSALHGLRARLRLGRHQRQRAHQRQCQCHQPDARLPGKGCGAGRSVPSVRRARLPHGALQRAHRARRAQDRRSARPGGARLVERRRSTRSTAISRTSAASSSRRTPKGSPVRRTTGARMPTAPTCWPTRWLRTVAS